MQKINLNQKIKVKITKKGREYLKYHDFYYNYPITVDEDGFSEFQLWELMGIFGGAMQYPTFSPVIEPDTFLLEDD